MSGGTELKAKTACVAALRRPQLGKLPLKIVQEGHHLRFVIALNEMRLNRLQKTANAPTHVL